MGIFIGKKRKGRTILSALSIYQSEERVIQCLYRREKDAFITFERKAK